MTQKYECPHMMDLLVDYLEDTLPKEKKSELDEHFAHCPPCVAFLESYKSTNDVCKNVLDRQMPGALKTSLKSFLALNCDNPEHNH